MAESTPAAAARDVTPDSSGRMAGEYRLGKKLGEGGFGTVYEAEHPLLKRRAAVKVLHRVAESESEAVQRFIAEAQAVNQIRSPHIVDIFSFGRLADGRHFYVMDLLEGEPLDRYMLRVERVDVATTIQLLRPIAAALDVAHAAGIVHRDLKPQNIFLAWDAADQTVPKLLDFGMAKLIGDAGVHTVSGTPMGTPLYMSPEQARGQKIDLRSDVYALGVLCHQMLTGQYPIMGETTIAVLMAHIAKDPPRASEVYHQLSPALDLPLLDMLAKEPAQRPSSAGEALAALARAAESTGVDIPPGLPRLPRPPPPVPSERPGELSNTFAAAESPSARLKSEGERAQARASAPEDKARGAFLGWLGLGVAVLGVVLYLAFGTGTTPEVGAPERDAAASEAPAAKGDPSPSPSALPVTTPGAEAPQGRAPADTVAPGEPSVVPEAGARPSRRRKDGVSAPRKSTIPSDLENPF